MKEINFNEIVFRSKKGCRNAYTLIYQLPCSINLDFINYMSEMGKNTSDLRTSTLININNSKGFAIKAKINSVLVRFKMPKKFEMHRGPIKEQQDFEFYLAKWVESQIGIKVNL